MVDRFTEVVPATDQPPGRGLRLRRARGPRAAGDPAGRSAGSRLGRSTRTLRQIVAETPDARARPDGPARRPAVGVLQRLLPTGLLPGAGQTRGAARAAPLEEASDDRRHRRRLEADPRLTDLARGFACRDWPTLPGASAASGSWASTRARTRPRRSACEYRAAADPDRSGRRAGPALDPRPRARPKRSWSPSRATSGPPAAASASAVRVAAARCARPARRCPATPSSCSRDLPVPYDVLDGTGPDGRALWRRAGRARTSTRPGSARTGPPVAEPRRPLGPGRALLHARPSRPATPTLTLSRHDGGDLDWYSVDADAPLGAVSDPAGAEPPSSRRGCSYPGAPLPRWWQIEDAQVDIGGYPPDRAHFATLLLIDLIVDHSDDWFTFPGRRPQRRPDRDHAGRGGRARLVRRRLGPRPARRLEPVRHRRSRPALAGPLGHRRDPARGPGARRGRHRHRRGRQPRLGRGAAVARARRRRDPRPDPTRRPCLPRAVVPDSPTGRSTRVPPHWHPYVVGGGRRTRAASSRGVRPTSPARPPCCCRRPRATCSLDPGAAGVHRSTRSSRRRPEDGLRLERRAMLARATTALPCSGPSAAASPCLPRRRCACASTPSSPSRPPDPADASTRGV